MTKIATPVKSYIPGRQVGPLVMTRDQVESQYRDLRRVGIEFSRDYIERRAANYTFGMDDQTSGATAPSITTPIQFLQNWLPGFVHEITAARRIDDLLGIMNSGSWEDEQIVQGILAPKNAVVPYGDFTNIPLANWNTNFVYRTVVRFEQGLKVGPLEAARAARVRVDSAGEKRRSAAMALEIQRNTVGFSGYNAGNNLTYGFLNDPGLPAYVNVPNGTGGSPLWSLKTALEIIADIQGAAAALQNQSQDNINPETTETTMAVATVAYQWLNTVSSLVANSVRTWMAQNYPKMRVVSAPQLNAANGGANVFYLYADNPQEASDSTDGGQTWLQVVPQKFMALGVEKQAKATVEDYSNATAGAMCKRPWAVVRRSGI